MAERNDRPERSDRRPGGRKGRKKVCAFCVDKVESIDYKDVAKPVSYTHLDVYKRQRMFRFKS